MRHSTNRGELTVKHPRAVDSSLHPAVIPAAVIAAGLIAPLPAWTAPGDLDPGFGDVGRVGLDLYGAAWSLDAAYSAAEPESVLGYDSVLQPDGKRVTAGESSASGDTDLVVYRLLADGS